ncbi:ribonuclease III [Calderihabitans maritimus]|uniref:Ribonuclease 3 n=1 Tax=Calderihabitans maritimus TaxID=1246530 RepID=A0A1Z5HP67_9FIRM|nr:ribonuclease III [Calderihabitans maritimus]GAW91070.1 ribonuclease III [Calderihabitans maritimus]
MKGDRKKQLAELQQKLGVSFKNWELLNRALTHPTYAFEHRELKLEHNQRLEFLGDAVLGMIMAEYLYLNYPHKPEGELTKMRAAVVCEPTLARKAAELGLGSYLLLGRGEELSGGRERASILADVFEAVIGALYLDKGVEDTRNFVLAYLAEEVKHIEDGGYGDYKTALQELVQKNFDDNVSYVILEETGPDHDKRFVAGVKFQERLLAKGSGRSKKEAEQKAAAVALEKIEQGEIKLVGDT